MKLKSIHFSGFKSFVDPTTLQLPSNIVGVVGPNGCGKSNVIDAIRWVMGESSAKTLRGDNMADVIFNGSSTRKPVSKASVELLFDNTQGRAPGAYSQYAEIAIKRSLTRDGKSDYYLNNLRCRRKDITDIFLGTGLGPRSYSIIEQGMISRVIEAKPEELRSFVEEAAGISKYKEKRRETENRIRHTRENMDRVTDVLTELETQIRRLDRQSKQAKRYKELKQQERELRGQTYALKWQTYNDKLNEFDATISRKQKELESCVANQRESEATIEVLREQISSSQASLNTIQGQFYGAGSDISKIEQRIEHKKENRLRHQQELAQVSLERDQIRQSLQVDIKRKTHIESELADIAPVLQELDQKNRTHQQELEKKEAFQQDWQKQWESFQIQLNQSMQQCEVLKARAIHLSGTKRELESRLQAFQEQIEAASKELNLIDPDKLLQQAQQQDDDCLEIQSNIENISIKINESRNLIKRIDENIKDAQTQMIEAGGKLQSHEELQKAALGQNDKEFSQWLRKSGLESNQRLTNLLVVEKGWEKAVDTVLDTQLASICVDDINQSIHKVEQMAHVDLNFIEPAPLPSDLILNKLNQPGLLSKIRCEIDLTGLLGNVFVAQSLEEALELRSQLTSNEFLVTPEGIQIGFNWISISKKQDVRSGTVKREKSIKQLSIITGNLYKLINTEELKREKIRLQQIELETLHTEKSKYLAQLNARRTELHNKLGNQEARIKALENKKVELDRESQELVQRLEQVVKSLAENEVGLTDIEKHVESSKITRLKYEQQREQHREELLICRQKSNQAREHWSNQRLSYEKLITLQESLDQAVTRSQQHIEFLLNREQQAQDALQSPQQHDSNDQQELQRLLDERTEVEKKLRRIRNQVSDLDMQISGQDQRRQKNEQLALSMREKLEGDRLAKQEILVKQQNIKEKFEELVIDLNQVVAAIPEDASLEVWQQQLNEIETKITRLGSVNLLAIEEYDEQQERKIYLDRQHLDLVKALSTLEAVMHKIDKETRHRFRKTFDALNKGFQEYFPQLFGGGSASLELTEDDLLTAGVTVMARPPGKRNSTIHLLSGGEKALTAVALMFSLFKLNPSPLCILDEVDAPLDDANVERYCKTLLQMAEHTQLLFITHSKITMEYAKILIGVTMQEPGVSRLVSVDVDEAVRLAS